MLFAKSPRLLHFSRSDSYAAVYLAAGLENLLEEIMMQCMPSDQETLLTASVLENAIANNGDLWGLLQPYAHLNAGRTATGNCRAAISDHFIVALSFFFSSFYVHTLNVVRNTVNN